MNPGSRNFVAGLLALAATGVLAAGAFVPSAAPAPAPIADVTECLTLPNHGACVNCCKAQGGDSNLCSAFCKNQVPPLPETQP